MNKFLSLAIVAGAITFASCDNSKTETTDVDNTTIVDSADNDLNEDRTGGIMDSGSTNGGGNMNNMSAPGTTTTTTTPGGSTTTTTTPDTTRR